MENYSALEIEIKIYPKNTASDTILGPNKIRHIQGKSRQQMTRHPDSLDDFVRTDYLVRVNDAFIKSLPIAELEFTQMLSKDVGSKPYRPAERLILST